MSCPHDLVKIICFGGHSGYFTIWLDDSNRRTDLVPALLGGRCHLVPSPPREALHFTDEASLDDAHKSSAPWSKRGIVGCFGGWSPFLFHPGNHFFWCRNLELFHWGPLSIPGAGGINVHRMVGKCWVKSFRKWLVLVYQLANDFCHLSKVVLCLYTPLGNNIFISPKKGTFESMIFLFPVWWDILIVPWRVNIKLPQLISRKIQLDDVLFTQARSIDSSCLSWARVATTQRMGRGGLKEGCNMWDLSNEQWKKAGCLGYIGDCTTQLCWDYIMRIRIPIKQSV